MDKLCACVISLEMLIEDVELGMEVEGTRQFHFGQVELLKAVKSISECL